MLEKEAADVRRETLAARAREHAVEAPQVAAELRFEIEAIMP